MKMFTKKIEGENPKLESFTNAEALVEGWKTKKCLFTTERRRSFLKAGTSAGTGFGMRRAVIRADGALREIAPVMTGRHMFVVFIREGLVRMFGSEHFLGAKMSATV